MSHSMAISILCGGIVGTPLISSSPSSLVASSQAPCCSVNIYRKSEDELGLSDDELGLSDDELDSDDNEPNWDDDELGWDGKLNRDGKLVCGGLDDTVVLLLLI